MTFQNYQPQTFADNKGPKKYVFRVQNESNQTQTINEILEYYLENELLK